MTQFKFTIVEGGAQRVCDTCAASVILHGRTKSEEFIFCTVMNAEVPFRVVHCNRMRPAVADLQDVGDDLLAEYVLE